MSNVTISNRFQIVIPKEIRERLKLKPKQQMILIEKDGVIHLLPDMPLQQLRGLLKGIGTDNIRDERDRF